MSEPAPRPMLRIGDAERDQAAEMLREHMAQGRLEHAEFDDRLGQALTAHTQAELDALFTDLPAPRPGQALAPSGSGPVPTFEPVAQPEPYRAPWWTHWGLFALAWFLTVITRGRLGILIPLAVVWVWWLGPSIAHGRHDARRRLPGGPSDRRQQQQILRQQGRDLKSQRRELQAQQRDLRQQRRDLRDERRDVRRRRRDGL